MGEYALEPIAKIDRTEEDLLDWPREPVETARIGEITSNLHPDDLDLLELILGRSGEIKAPSQTAVFC
jgi:hypothetical protein